MRNNQGCHVYTSHATQMVQGDELRSFEEGEKLYDSQGRPTACSEINGVLPSEGAECRVAVATALRG